jgi:hypothetical protein
MTDSCIISKYTLSKKQQSLKDRLFGSSAKKTPAHQPSEYKPLTPAPSSMQKTPISYTRPPHQTLQSEELNSNMNNFISEMRTQFSQTKHTSKIFRIYH